MVVSLLSYVLLGRKFYLNDSLFFLAMAGRRKVGSFTAPEDTVLARRCDKMSNEQMTPCTYLMKVSYGNHELQSYIKFIKVSASWKVSDEGVEVLPIFKSFFKDWVLRMAICETTNSRESFVHSTFTPFTFNNLPHRIP